jgi:hypothetical protein
MCVRVQVHLPELTNELALNFDMSCSVHFCDNNFYNQQMHTLYFVGHFRGLPTCFDRLGWIVVTD